MGAGGSDHLTARARCDGDEDDATQLKINSSSALDALCSKRHLGDMGWHDVTYRIRSCKNGSLDRAAVWDGE